MRDDWKDKDFAVGWANRHLRGNPTREEQLQILVALIKGTYRPGLEILDLGCGSGIVEERIFQEIPGVHVVGVDFSPVMLELVSTRLRRWSAQLRLVEADFSEIESIELPKASIQIVISVQALHHVSQKVKKRAFAVVHDLLTPAGVFYILDRMRVNPDLFDQIRLVWDRLEAVHHTKISEGSNYSQHIESLKENGDDPASLGEHMLWLKDAGFAATCVHLHGNRALIVARPV